MLVQAFFSHFDFFPVFPSHDGAILIVPQQRQIVLKVDSSNTLRARARLTSTFSPERSSSGLLWYLNVVDTCIAGAMARWLLIPSSAWTESVASESSLLLAAAVVGPSEPAPGAVRVAVSPFVGISPAIVLFVVKDAK